MTKQTTEEAKTTLQDLAGYYAVKAAACEAEGNLAEAAEWENRGRRAARLAVKKGRCIANDRG